MTNIHRENQSPKDSARSYPFNPLMEIFNSPIGPAQDKSINQWPNSITNLPHVGLNQMGQMGISSTQHISSLIGLDCTKLLGGPNTISNGPAATLN